MKVTLWGTRGSIASPGPETVRYGGNTTCLSVETNSGQVIIIDGGTGIRKLGIKLMGSLPVNCDILITHTHWDHIQGLPFFIPLFVPGNELNFHGAFDPVYNKSLKDILAGQMEYCYFPVRESELNANISYHRINDGHTFEMGDAKITAILMNHPVLNYGYKIEADGHSFFFTGDHEPPRNIYSEEDEEFAEYQSFIDLKNEKLYRLLENIDLLVADSSYTTEEYKTKIGWGHGTFDSSLEMGRHVKAKKLVFTHHEPTRNDEALDTIFAEMKNKVRTGDPEIFMAVEGHTFDLSADD
ncbi:MAG: MBL fold metallo-hydrolase [Myxococcota bacterium]|nr:MBL fold metallo-hydrolase [Myxococcota bacterium]